MGDTLRMNLVTSYQYLVDPVQAREAMAAFAHQPVIGLDTETFWDYSARLNRLSLLQLATPTGEVVVIDALAAGLEEARGLIESPNSMMAAHNARFDDGILRQAGFEVAGLVDTLKLARRTLRLQSFSLASVSEHLFGLALDKTYQRSDWLKRPLSREQLNYAALDAVIALRVFQELTGRLDQEGRLHVELKRARITRPSDGQPSPRRERSAAKRAPVDLRPLTSEEQQALERLRSWRKQMAQSEHLPPYLVCHDRTLEHLVILRPQTIEDLNRVTGLGPSKIAKYGAQLLAQLIDT